MKKVLLIAALTMFFVSLPLFGQSAQKPKQMVLMNAGSLSGDPGIDMMRKEWGAKNGIPIEVIEQAETYLFDKELSALSSHDASIDILAANERWIQD